jgi:hypothetical protein
MNNSDYHNKDEVFNEIKKALDFAESKPPATISIPSAVIGNRIIHASSSSSSTSSPDKEEYVITGQNTHTTATTTTTTTRTTTPMMTKTTNIIGSNFHVIDEDHNDATDGPTSQLTVHDFSMEDEHNIRDTAKEDESQKFCIVTGVNPSTNDDNDDDDDDDDEIGTDGSSMQSKVNLLQTDEMSKGELIDLIERLYDNLKNADRTLTKEKTRRIGREKSLIKLAKELRRRKDMVEEYIEQIEEVRLCYYFLSLTLYFIKESCLMIAYLLRTSTRHIIMSCSWNRN